jgi:hypothetical protein
MKSQNNFSSHNIFHINQYHRVLTRQVIKILFHHHITSTIPNIIYSIIMTRQAIYPDVLAPGINSCNSQTPIINSIASDLAIHIWCSNIYLCSICHILTCHMYFISDISHSQSQEFPESQFDSRNQIPTQVSTTTPIRSFPIHFHIHYSSYHMLPWT